MKSNATRVVQQVKSEWESTVDSLPQLICVLRYDGTLLRVNRTIELWGLDSVEKVKGKSIHGLIHPGCRSPKCYLKRFSAMHTNVLQSDESIEYRGYDKLLNKELLIQLIPIGIENEGLGHLVMIFHDISRMSLTELDAKTQTDWDLLQKLDVKSLQEQKAQSDAQRTFGSTVIAFDFLEKIKREWETAVDSLPQIICLLDSSGSIVRINKAIEQWKLADVMKIYQRNVHELLHPNCQDELCYLNRLNEQIFNVISSGQVSECQRYDAILKKYLNIQINSFFASTSADNHFVVMSISDISNIKQVDSEIENLNDKLEKRIKTRTAHLQKINQKLKKEIELRKLVELQYKESRQKFSHLVEMLNEGMVIRDIEGRITYVNRHLLKMLKLTKAEVIGQFFTKFVERDFLDVWADGSLKDVKSAESSYVFKMKGIEGHSFWVKGNPQPLLNAEKDAIGSFAVITDINEQIEIEQKLLKTESKLRSLAKQVLYAQELERKRIASELHDGICQSLSAIKFYVENNIKDLITSPNKTSVKKLEFVIPKLQQAIEDVRRIYMDLRPSMLDDIGILATLSWFCRETNQASPHINFSFNQINVVESNINNSLKIEMFRIVQEAVNNAIKHSKAKHVVIILGDTQKLQFLEIKDDGVGFDYMKVTSQVGYSGSKGMGLVSIRERAENSGGEFEVTSNNTGTKVHCCWYKVKRDFVDTRSGRLDRRSR